MKLLDADHTHQVDQHLTTVTNLYIRGPGVDALNSLLRLYIRTGGKRLRPHLTVWTYQHASPAAPAGARLPPAVLDVACAWELFHAFLLIHDDIIDGSDYRRDRASLHRQLQSLDSNSPRFGTNMGIVAGDMIYAAVNQLLSVIDVTPGIFRALHGLFARVSAATGAGQAIDIMQSHVALGACDEATLLAEYKLKTAAYTFAGPMLSAAILAEVDAVAYRAIERFAEALGQAYQIHNDLVDLSRPAADGSDIVEGKRTVTLLRARRLLPAAEHERFDTRLAEIQSTGRTELAEMFRRDILATGAADLTRQTIDDLLSTARRASTETALPQPLQIALADLLDQLGQRYFSHV